MEKQNSKDTIINSSLELFAQRGFDAAGISEITAKAGITKPTLYYFFESKEGLFTAILEQYFMPFNQEIKKAAVYIPDQDNYENDVYPLLKRILHTAFNSLSQNKNFAFLFSGILISPPDSTTYKLSKNYITELNSIMEKTFIEIGQAHGNVKGKHKLLSLLFISQLATVVNLWLRSELKLDAKLEHNLIHQFMHGIYA